MPRVSLIALLPVSVASFQLLEAKGLRRLPASTTVAPLCSLTTPSSSTPSWLQDLKSMPFECTECGRCCQREQGDVYMCASEMEAAASLLGMDLLDFLRTYADHVLENDEGEPIWMHMTNKPGAGGCAFLDTETKHCRIYQVRPLQCSAYPFYPELLGSPQDWNAECRARDDEEESKLPKWTPSTMGCEGMHEIGTEMEGFPMDKALDYLERYTEYDQAMYDKKKI